jgi:threonine dehydrogenase-like Zn-dependent dehydrogenase
MKITNARAFWITAPGSGAIHSEALAARSADEVLIRTLYSGVSRGTESLVFNGRIPLSQYQLMRAPFQTGDFPAPLKYGYSSVGVVEAGPSALLGQTVFCLYPHQSAYIVPASAVIPLPPGLPAARAILAANMETALNGLWDATPRLGDRIVVIGAGTVGLLSAYLAARIPGCEVHLIDIATEKATIANTLGLGFIPPEQAPQDADLIIHASGAPEGLRLALTLAAFETTIVELSWYGDQQVTLPLGEAFHVKRLRLYSSQVGSVASSQRARWDYHRRLTTALHLLEDPLLDHVINSECSFNELPQRMTELANNPGTVLCHRVCY